MSRFLRRIRRASAYLLLPHCLLAYSFQTHQQIIDFAWTDTIKPLLKQRFNGLSDADLVRAHAYAYGGCAIQDLGYYPFGNHFFSDLTHYVRSADFIRSLFRHARNANELAFAIGALSHYVGDTVGHDDAVNRAVAIEFPKLAKQFGPSVNYGENPRAHIRTEFAFDIDQISLHHLAPAAYLRHVGLRVPQPLLAEAFSETYGLSMRKILSGRRPVIRGYRFAVRSFLPRIAYAENVLHGKSFPPARASEAARLFEEQLARTEFENGWGPFRKKAGIGTHLVAGVIFILPKFGPLADLAIRGPETETIQLYIESVNRSTSWLRDLLHHLDSSPSMLPNRDLDTGQHAKPGTYRLTDETYARLLHEVTRSPSRKVPETLKQNMLDYYSDPAAPISTKSNKKRWERVQSELAALRGMNTTPKIVEE